MSVGMDRSWTGLCRFMQEELGLNYAASVRTNANIYSVRKWGFTQNLKNTFVRMLTNSQACSRNTQINKRNKYKINKRKLGTA